MGHQISPPTRQHFEGQIYFELFGALSLVQLSSRTHELLIPEHKKYYKITLSGGKIIIYIHKIMSSRITKLFVKNQIVTSGISYSKVRIVMTQ